MIDKLKNNKFVSSTLLLLIGGVLGKAVGFILKIIITRKIGSEGMGIYSMLSPTISLLSTIAVLSYPTSISKIVSEEKCDIYLLFSSIIPFSILINTILIIVVIIMSNFLATDLLHEEGLTIPIIFVSVSMPFISISSIIKGYFWGKLNMFPYMLSNFLEQVARLILISLFISKYTHNIYSTICFIICVNMFGEVVSQIVMLLFISKSSFDFKKINFSFSIVAEIMKTSIPVTLSRLIGSFAYFLEPIVLTNSLMLMGMAKDRIVYEYGIINAYSLSILLMPQFFIQNMSTSLVPEVAKFYSNNNFDMCKKRIAQIVFISVLIGGVSTFLIGMFPSFFLDLIYHTQEGRDYIRILCPFVILFYIEYPLINALQAIGASKKAMKCSVFGSFLRLLSIASFALLNFKIYSYILSIIINLIISTYLYYNELKKLLSSNNKT